ncbi:MAG: hypothetical protein SXA11_01690 [Cyanobacteriota bacterium]|nr:hypothetical protein [Cyanobacteriota bacterium]
MKKCYYLVIDDVEIAQSNWTGFLVEIEGSSKDTKNNRDKVKNYIELLWEEGLLPPQYFANGFIEENIIMARTKKDTDRELLPIEEAGNNLIELIDLVAQKLKAQQDYLGIASMVEKVFSGKESELDETEIAQALDSKSVKNIISQLTKTIAEVELCRQRCKDHEDLILGVVEAGKDGSPLLKPAAEVIAESEPSNNKSKGKKSNNSKNSSPELATASES